MKKLKKAEWAIVILTLVCLVFTAGFFVGRASSGGIVTIEKLGADVNASVFTEAADADTAASPVLTDYADAGVEDSSGLADGTAVGADDSAGLADDTAVGADDSAGLADDTAVGADDSAGLVDEPSADTPADAGQADDASGKININTASASLLDSLPGIGEVLAGRIIEYRELNGGFKSIEEITEVSGIGDKKFSDIKDLITV